MAKKPFAWVRDAEEPLIPSPHRPTRKERGADRNEAKKLLPRLLALSSAALKKLPIDDDLFDAIHHYRSIPDKSHGARKRQMLRLETLLRDVDFDEIEAGFTANRDADLVRDRRAQQAVDWRDRLVDEGDVALGELLDGYPNADRQTLRSAMMQARKGSPKAMKSLNKAIRDALASDG